MFVHYLKFVEKLNISSGNIIFIASDISKLAYEAQENDIVFNINEFIDAITNKIGNEGTLILPVYNWDFCKNIPFDYNKTIGKTGYLGNAALKRNDFIRTKHPIYSFAVWGKDKHYLASIDNIHAFGKNTVYQYLIDNHATNIAINVNFNDHYTICHQIEQLVGVPYRYNKYFKGDYIDVNNNISKKTYSMSVRYLELSLSGDAVELYNEMLDKKIAYEQKIGSHTVSYIDIAKSVAVIENDIK